MISGKPANQPCLSDSGDSPFPAIWDSIWIIDSTCQFPHTPTCPWSLLGYHLNSNESAGHFGENFHNTGTCVMSLFQSLHPRPLSFYRFSKSLTSLFSHCLHKDLGVLLFIPKFLTFFDVVSNNPFKLHYLFLVCISKYYFCTLILGPESL